MSLTVDLTPEAILLGVAAQRLADVIGAAAAALGPVADLDPQRVRRALEPSASDTGFAVGDGIAVPHAAVDGIPTRAVAIVRTTTPLQVGALDGAPVDVFFVVLYPAGDPLGHLRFLAHLAGMCGSRVFRDGLRAAATPQEVIELVAAAEARLGIVARAPTSPVVGQRGLAIISVTGERAADSILVGLVREELASATILDAQTVQDAASREVPLFAAFRDLFGDPGGRRVILAQVDLEHADALAAIVQRACEEERSATAELVVVPIANRWEWRPVADQPPERTGH